MSLLPGFCWDKEIPNRHGLKFRGFYWGWIFIGTWQFTRARPLEIQCTTCGRAHMPLKDFPDDGNKEGS
jgi:hypothetical protein